MTHSPTKAVTNRALWRLHGMLAEYRARQEALRATMTTDTGSSGVTVKEVDTADGRVYAENEIGLTMCLTPEQIRVEPMTKVIRFMDMQS